MEILQIVPRLPPAINGVGDYAYLLAKQLRAAHDIDTVFIVCDPEWEKAESDKNGRRTTDHGPLKTLDGFPVHQLRERSSQELLRIISAPGMPATVLLQYVGYGYEKRGCPVWLVRALTAWRGQSPVCVGQTSALSHSSPGGRRLVTMFHELYAFGPPWRSSFWTSPVQRWAAAHLARISDACVTNMRRSARWIVSAASRHSGNIKVFPVFSNVTEPEMVPMWSDRNPWLLIFGGNGWIRRALEDDKAALLECCQVLRIERLIIVGSFEGARPRLNMGVEWRGTLPAQEVSRILLNSRAGWLSYPVGFLGKSGIFAAYTSHGVTTILPEDGENEDGLLSGREYAVARELTKHNSNVPIHQLGERAHNWYRNHTLKATALNLVTQLPPLS